MNINENELNAISKYASRLVEVALSTYDSNININTKTNIKSRKYIIDTLEANRVNTQYLLAVKKSSNAPNWEEFIETVPEYDRERYERNKNLVTKYLIQLKENGEYKENNIKITKELASEVCDYDKRAKYICDYYKDLIVAKTRLAYFLKKTPEELEKVLNEDFKQIKDIFNNLGL